MKISIELRNKIKQEEGLRLTSYLCPSKVWTIGWGHTLTAKPGMTITKEQAESLLSKDIARFEDAVNSYVKVPLNQNQFDALVSFVYNVGAGNFLQSTLLKVLNQKNYDQASKEFLRWNKGSGGKVLSGLVTRRANESKLFSKAPAQVVNTVKSDSTLAIKILNRLKELNCKLTALIIVYLEDSDAKGNPLPESLNSFNDRSIILRYYTDKDPEILFNALATTEPGKYYTLNPMNPKGAAQIKLDTQFLNAWEFGYHGTGKYSHFALRQCRDISVLRDYNKDSSRVGDKEDRGQFYINQHGIYGYNQPVNDIGRSSAGCLVRFDYADHLEFMEILQENHPRDYKFNTIVLDTTKL
jgi:lysozyme